MPIRRDLIIFALLVILAYLTFFDPGRSVLKCADADHRHDRHRPISPEVQSVSSTDEIRSSSAAINNCEIFQESPAPSTLNLKSIINLPDWFRNEDWGLQKDTTREFRKIWHRGIDGEEETAWLNFFYRTTNGLMLEMGALNGKVRSVSVFFEVWANWRTILIEANPVMAAQLSKNRPKALNFNLAICDSPKTVHYITHYVRHEVNGILEFMSPGFLKTLFPELILSNGTEPDWVKVEMDPRVKKVPCVPLMSVLEPLGITHINFFVLDVENAELSVLKAIDFNKIRFDVISIETDRGVDDVNATKEYVDAVIDFLTSKSYILWKRKVGENTWVTHPDFVPFKKKQTRSVLKQLKQ